MMEIMINLGKLCGCENGTDFYIESCNCSGLYYGKYSNGEELRLTRNELKKLVNINNVDETLENLANLKAGRVYTDDGMNFITKEGLDQLRDAADYYKVSYTVVE